MGTDKKNRMQREDKDLTGSVDNGSGNGSTDASASLAARRAKLRGALGGRGQSGAPNYSTDPFSTPPSSFQNDPFAAQSEPSQNSSQASYENEIENYIESNSTYVNPETAVNVYGVPVTVEPETASEKTEESLAESVPEPRIGRSRRNTSAQSTLAGSEPSPFEAAPPSTIRTVKEVRPPVETPMAASGLVSEKTVELVNSIDQSLNVCATNLATLQNLAGEQNEVLRGLSQTLQNQTLLEIGLNLNSLTESLTAALEPMKAIGELVPALDALVSTLEGREQSQAEKLSPDQLVTSLADQLSAGLIDPWTFKCAYMAVYPADHPADLLHRLVELLGSQRLSGDLFRAAYEAVQAAEPPARSFSSGSAPAGDYRGVTDDTVRAQLENLDRANREMQERQEARERELQQILEQKEAELQAAQEQLNQRLEELNNRYADAADMIASREEEFRAALESKDMDLIEKDAELNMLRAQMEELRQNTEEMVKDLQREMLSLRDVQMGAPPQQAHSDSNSQGFFDSPQAQSAQRSGGLFEAAPPSKPVFAPADSSGFGHENNYAAPEGGFSDSGQGFAPATPPNPGFQGGAGSGGFQAPAAPAFQAPPAAPVFQPPQPAPVQAAPAQQMAQPARSAPGPTPPTTPFGSQSGSYGMGVRQQVFEVIVRQALAGAPWREICAGPMQVNNISPDEVEAEVKRRQSLLNK